MGRHVLLGNPPVELRLRRSHRARRISLRVSGLDGRVTLTVPRGVAVTEALEFARSKGDWLRAQMLGQADTVLVGCGVPFPLEGQVVRIAQGTGRRIVADGPQLLVPGPADTIPARLHAWLKACARDRLAAASDHYAARLGRPYTRLTLRDTRSRWGSCSAAGTLSYSWRLSWRHQRFSIMSRRMKWRIWPR